MLPIIIEVIQDIAWYIRKGIPIRGPGVGGLKGA